MSSNLSWIQGVFGERWIRYINLEKMGRTEFLAFRNGKIQVKVTSSV